MGTTRRYRCWQGSIPNWIALLQLCVYSLDWPRARVHRDLFSLAAGKIHLAGHQVTEGRPVFLLQQVKAHQPMV